MPDGIMATFFYAFDLPVPGKEKDNEDFVTKFKQRAGYEPKSGDVIGYISTYMMAEAIERAGSTNRSARAKRCAGGNLKRCWVTSLFATLTDRRRLAITPALPSLTPISHLNG